MCDEEYRNTVAEYIRDDSPKIFGNYSRAHAACVTSAFLNAAQRSVVILSGSFPHDFYFDENIGNELRCAIERVAGNGGKVRIITVDGKKNETLSALAEESKGVFEYRAGHYSGNDLAHFMVVDGKRYRLEAVHDKNEKTPEVVRAEVCCNGVKKADELLSFFNAAWCILTPREEVR